MYIKRVKKENGAISIRIVKSIRRPNGQGIQYKILKVVGQSKDPGELRALEKAASEIIYLRNIEEGKIQKTIRSKSQVDVSFGLNETVEVARVNDGIFEVFGQTYDRLGLNTLIIGSNKDDQWNRILKALVISRISSPDSKRRTAEVLSQDYLFNFPLEKFYRTMDRLLPFKNVVEKLILTETQRLHGGRISVMLFDVTTLYFESFEKDELRASGFSKDCKFKEVQIVLSLMTTESGLPVGYKLFPGNTSECKTLIAHLKEVKSLYKLNEVLLVADRAMFSDNNLLELEKEKIKYIVACKIKTLSKKIKNSMLSDSANARSSFDENSFWFKDYEYNKRRLIVSYSPKRASKDKKMRDKLLQRFESSVSNGKINLNKVIGNNGTKKFLKTQGQKVELDKEKIIEDSFWDGLHGIITNDATTPSLEVIGNYKKLWRIEEAFRINKTDLKMRPIYHWRKDRIESHILICYMAFAIGTFTMNAINTRLESKLSLRACTEELLRVESSILKNKNEQNKNLYILPSSLTAEQANIYTAAGIRRRSNVRKVSEV